jgi:hypothetical protein
MVECTGNRGCVCVELGLFLWLCYLEEKAVVLSKGTEGALVVQSKNNGFESRAPKKVGLQRNAMEFGYGKEGMWY